MQIILTVITRSLVFLCVLSSLTLVYGCIRSGYSGNGHADAGDTGVADTAIEASQQQEDGGGLAAARLTEQGAVLVWSQHDVASDGKGYAAAWVEHPPGDLSLRLAFATVSSEGTLEHGPILVTALDKELSLVELFWAGDHYVLFYRKNGSSEVTAARLKLSGSSLEVTSGSAGSYSQPYFYARDDGFAVAYVKNETCDPQQTWSENQVYLRPLDADGLPAADPVRVECTGKSQGYPKAAWTGSRHFVIWTDYRSGTRVYYATMGKDLSPLQPSEPLLDLKATQSARGLASGGQGRVLASWTQGGKLWHFAANEDGSPLWSEAKALIPENRMESLTTDTAGGGGRAAMVWETDYDTVLVQIKLVSFDLTQQATPQALDAKLVSHLDYNFLVPKVARGPGGFGVTFWGQVEGERGLFFEVVPD